MKLEEEIKQLKFENDHQKALLNILVTGNWINGIMNTLLKPYGISPQQFNVLRILKGQSPAPSTLSLIQERMLDKMSNASRLVDKLVKKSLVERKQCASSRRQVDIKITEEGIHLLRDLEIPIKEFGESLQIISCEEARQLNCLLDKLRV